MRSLGRRSLVLSVVIGLLGGMLPAPTAAAAPTLSTHTTDLSTSARPAPYRGPGETRCCGSVPWVIGQEVLQFGSRQLTILGGTAVVPTSAENVLKRLVGSP